jgi:hypothetical protein
MTRTSLYARDQPSMLVRDGLVSLCALLLVVAAFDDITTDNATDFTAEYVALLLSAAWFGYVALRLTRFGLRTLGILSFVAIAGAAWGQQALGHATTPGDGPGYLVTAVAIFWFFGLATSLLFFGWRGLLRARRG